MESTTARIVHEPTLKTNEVVTINATRKLREFGFSSNDLKKITQDVRDLKHGYESPHERIDLILKNPIYIDKYGNLMVPFWLESTPRPQGGDCVDLAEDLIFKWHLDSFVDETNAKGCDIIFCQGRGPDFFSGKESNHIFLAIGKSKNGDKRTFVDSEVVIVDPSLQTIDLLSDSNYIIRDGNRNMSSLTNRLHKPIQPTEIPPDYNPGNFDISLNKDRRLIIGLDPKRQFAVFLAVSKYKESYSPFLTIVDKDTKEGAVLVDPKSQKIVDAVSHLRGINDETKQYFRKLVEKLRGVEFVKAKYEDHQPRDIHGTPLLGDFHKSVF